MDPLSPLAILHYVTSVGGAVLKLSIKLQSFIKAAKIVNKSVLELDREVQVLKNVLDTAKHTLAETIDHAQDPTLSVNGIWTSFKHGMDDCRVTVEAFDSVIQDVGVDCGSRNPFKKAFKQVKFSLSTDQITAIRSRIHTHSICLQLVLQMLDVSLSFSSRTDFKIIMSKLDKLASAIAGVRVAQSSEHANLPVIFGNPDLKDHTERLRRRADAALFNASSVIGAGSAQDEGTLYDPDTVSEFGIPLSTAKQDGIKKWTQDLYMDANGSNSRTMEKDLSIRIVKDIFDRAERSWAKVDCLEAEKLFRAGMDRAKTLGPIKRQVLNLNDIRLKLAFALLHREGFFEAIQLFTPLSRHRGFKGLLNSILQKSAIIKAIPCRHYAYFGLAQAYLGKSCLSDAEKWCQKCIDCRKDSTRKRADPLYSNSLQLMAYIHQAKGDSIVAKAFFEVAIQEGYETNQTTSYMQNPEALSAFRLLMISGPRHSFRRL